MAQRRVTWLDLGLTSLLVAVGLMGTGGAAANQGQSASPLAYVLVVAACLPVVAWRWRPMWTFTLTGAATMVYLGLGYPYGPILFALVLAIVGLAVRSPVRRVLAAMAALLAAAFVAIGIDVLAGERDWTEFLTVSAWLIVPAAVGAAIKVRRDAAADVRAALARRAVSEERLLLAQEVHDVVGHGLAVIAMQSGVALRVLERDPARAREALEAIRATSGEALESLRAEVEALRRGAQEPDVPRRPGTGLADLPRLVDRIRASGLAVTLDADGPAAGLPAEVDRAAYRIVQEALTNVLRHGGPAATATVRVARDGGTLLVEVLDTGRGTGVAPAGGHGIEGMRARAEALGGSLEAGPRPDGGFGVRARMLVTAGGGTA